MSIGNSSISSITTDISTLPFTWEQCLTANDVHAAPVSYFPHVDKICIRLVEFNDPYDQYLGTIA
jgi:hypothetical protein